MSDNFADKYKLPVNIAIALCYAIFTFFIVLEHEIWADEAQVWLLVQNLNPSGLFRELFEEGHPPFFYLLVMPFAKTGLSIFSMQLICWLSSVFGVFLLFNYSPFKWQVNSAIVLSCGFLYSFPVIARNYSLLPFLVFLLAILYSRRHEKPLLYSSVLFLISQTHVIMLGFVSVLTVCYIYEIFKAKSYTPKNILSVLLIISGILFVLSISFSTVHINEGLNYTKCNFYTVLIFVLRFFATALNAGWSDLSMNLVWLYNALFFISIGLLYKFSPKNFIIALVSCGFQFAVYILFYFSPIYLTRISVMFLILIFAYWISWNDCNNKMLKNYASVLLVVLMLATGYNGYKFIKSDYIGAYSGSKETALFIKNNIEKDAVLITDYVPYIIALKVYLNDDYKIYKGDTGEYINYAIWKRNINKTYSDKEWNKYLLKNNSDKNIYLILTDKKHISNTETIFVSQDSIAEKEKFYILKYKGKGNE